jgi:hypothetical protein
VNAGPPINIACQFEMARALQRPVESGFAGLSEDTFPQIQQEHHLI